MNQLIVSSINNKSIKQPRFVKTDQLPELQLILGIRRRLLRARILFFARKTYLLPVIVVIADLFLKTIELRVKSEILQLVDRLFLVVSLALCLELFHFGIELINTLLKGYNLSLFLL